MSNISMLSGITKGKATSCCSLAIQTSTARSPCNAASDWVGSCAIIIEKQRDRTSKVQSEILNSDSVAAIGDRGSCGRRFATRCLNSGASVTLRHPMNYRFFRPFQFFDHTGGVEDEADLIGERRAATGTVGGE